MVHQITGKCKLRGKVANTTYLWSKKKKKKKKKKCEF